MSWLENQSLTCIQKCAINVIKCGPVPRHVAFIADGSRRYARLNGFQRKEGHTKGFALVKRLTYLCKELGIPELTVYMFSIDNFKRSADEVKDIMDIMRDELNSILEGKDEFIKDDICIRAIGQLSRLPADVRKLYAEVTILTKNNNKVFLNLAVAYTSRAEITDAINIVANGVSSGSLEIEDIDEQLLSNCMYTKHSPDPDVLVRTSGEIRFSDFLLWQMKSSTIYFENTLWPEFGFWSLLKIIFFYQRSYNKLNTMKEKLQTQDQNMRTRRFLQNLDAERLRVLQKYIKNV